MTFTTSATPAAMLSPMSPRTGWGSNQNSPTPSLSKWVSTSEVTWEFAPAEDVSPESSRPRRSGGRYVARPMSISHRVFDPYLETTTVPVLPDDARRVLSVSQQTQPSSLRFAAPVQGMGQPLAPG